MFNLLGSPLGLPKQKYLIMGFALLATLFVSLVGTFLTSYTSSSNNRKALNAQKELQEDAQEFTHRERVEQNEYEQQMYEFNLLNSPLLTSQGLQAAGVSSAGAAQALVGASSTGFSPTASNQGSGIASVPNLNASTDVFQGLGQAFNDFFTNKLNDVKHKETESNIKVNAATIVKWNKEIDLKARELDIQQESVDCAKIVANAQSEKDLSQAQVNKASLKRISSEVAMNFAKIQNLDANTALQYVEASKVIAETSNIQADITLKGVQTELVYGQVVGQNLSNLDQEMVNYMKKKRIEISDALGCDIDADDTTKILEAMALGRWDTVDDLLYAVDATDSNFISSFLRIGKRGDMISARLQEFGSSLTSDRSHHYKRGFSPSMQSDWNHGLYFKHR